MGKFGIVVVSLIAVLTLASALFTGLYAETSLHQILAAIYWIGGLGFIGLAFLLHSIAKLRESLVDIAWRSGIASPTKAAAQLRSTEKSEAWECPRCGRINASTELACACGTSKPSLRGK